MVLEYDFIDSTTVYRYKLTMIQGKVIEESLYRKKRGDFILSFHSDFKGVKWGTRIFLANQVDEVNKLVSTYKPKYTVLSILNFIYSDQSPNKIRVHESLGSTLDLIKLLYINIEGYYLHSEQVGYLEDHDYGPFEGYVVQKKLAMIEQVLPLFNSILGMLFPNFSEINYKITKIKDNFYKYEIQVYFKNSNGSFLLAREDVPKSLYEFLVIMGDQLSNPKAYYFVADDFAYNISSFGLESFFEIIFPTAKLQGIFSMTDNDAMNLLNPADIHIAWSNLGIHNISRLTTLFNFQQNHNLRSRFERGMIAPSHSEELKEMVLNMDRFSRFIK